MPEFSKKLELLLGSKQPITLKALTDSFVEKSFAIVLLLLLAVSALPLPTGGITHIFEIIAMLVSIELIVGRKTLWLPKKWLNKNIPRSLQKSALPKFIKIIKWFEKHSRPRLTRIQSHGVNVRIEGLIILLFIIFAFFAPPFSGLDTLPSLGVLVISLSLIFDDYLLAIIGIAIGSIGVGLILTLGDLAFKLL